MDPLRILKALSNPHRLDIILWLKQPEKEFGVQVHTKTDVYKRQIPLGWTVILFCMCCRCYSVSNNRFCHVAIYRTFKVHRMVLTIFCPTSKVYHFFATFERNLCTVYLFCSCNAIILMITSCV